MRAPLRRLVAQPSRSRRAAARVLAALALSAFAGLGMGAVEPAAAATSPILLNAGSADKPVEPTVFASYRDGSKDSRDPTYVHELEWSSWGQAEASGSGSVRSLGSDEASAVAVTLSAVKTCGGFSVYTHYALTLAEGAKRPKGWPRGQSGDFPCLVNAGAYYPSFNRRSADAGGCQFRGLGLPSQTPSSFIVDLPSFEWKPALDYNVFCRMQWKGWGKSSVTGTGVFRDGLRQWGVKVELSRLAWCPQLTVTYTRATMTRYGDPETITGHGNITRAEADHLRHNVGRKGIKTQRFRQTVPKSWGCRTI